MPVEASSKFCSDTICSARFNAQDVNVARFCMIGLTAVLWLERENRGDVSTDAIANLKLNQIQECSKPTSRRKNLCATPPKNPVTYV